MQGEESGAGCRGTGPGLTRFCAFKLIRPNGKRPRCTYGIAGPGAQRPLAAASITSRLSHPVSPVSPVALPGRAEGGCCYTFYYSARYAKALSLIGKGLELRKLVAGAGFEPATSGL